MSVLIMCAAVAFISGMIGYWVTPRDEDIREETWSTVFVVASLAVGYAVGLRRDLSRATADRLADLERESKLLDAQARSAERAEISREMHDIVGYHVSNIVLTAGALRLAQEPKAPDVAKAAEQIESYGRQALEELRGVLGALSREAARDSPAWSDGFSLQELADRANRVGQHVSLSINGFLETLPWRVQKALYRTLQESLTNAAKHAPGAEVIARVDCEASGVLISVRNVASLQRPESNAPSGGHGLAGLGERIALLGGTLSAEPQDGGFKTTVFIPHHGRSEDISEERV
ncbi:sensor histidine kinase [Streptomyces wuyuanensis]|uniref:sensor histidine kinase n=1 Tax=Streptomyces wuyuanensis TaxID=1196353 RepID=UPI003442BA7B